MRTRLLLTCLLSGLSILATPPAAAAGAAAEAPENLLSWGAGALLLKAPPSYAEGVGAWTALSLQDERADTGWASPENDIKPKTFVFELAERSEITQFEFDTAAADQAGRDARSLRVELSDRLTDGWREVAQPMLAPQADGQKFPLKSPATGRYLRLTVLDNHGAADYLELMEFRALGRRLATTPVGDQTGLFNTNYGPFRVYQDGTAVAGCYDQSEGVIENGGFEGRVLRFDWRQPERRGPAIMIFAADGQSFTGFWWNDGETGGPAGAWNGQRESKVPGSCPHWTAAKNSGAAGLAGQLKKDGRVRLYGILFDTGSDRIRPESKATLDDLVETAKAQPDWQLEIGGHTDNVGGEAMNQGLSERRAAAVKAWLVANGVDGARLSTRGYGASSPVAGNDTAAGRSQNRRVEVQRR